MKAQASARVDVPTALFFFAERTKKSDTCASFCANAWLCACQAIDRDLERASAVKKMNAWICAPPTTDHDPASVTPDKKRKYVRTYGLFELASPVTFSLIFITYEMVFELFNDLRL